MKKYKDLSKDERHSLKFNYDIKENFINKNLECALCGMTPNADFYYICDRCAELLNED
jgi:hypothetical protein